MFKCGCLRGLNILLGNMVRLVTTKAIRAITGFCVEKGMVYFSSFILTSLSCSFFFNFPSQNLNSSLSPLTEILMRIRGPRHSTCIMSIQYPRQYQHTKTRNIDSPFRE